jgi:DNA-binding protein HU-beta
MTPSPASHRRSHFCGPAKESCATVPQTRARMVHNVGMNKRDLAKAVAVHSDVNLSTVTKVLDGFTDVVTAIVSKGEPVLLTGFAKFTKVERAARMGRNPATGEQIHIKASKRARISAAKTFKDAVLAPSKAPKLARGVWPIDAEAVKRAGAVEAAPVKKAAAVKRVTRKAPARSAVAKRTTATKRAAATKRPAAKKAVAKRTAAKRPAVRKTAATKRTAARKAAPAARKRAVKKVASARSATKRAPRRGR